MRPAIPAPYTLNSEHCDQLKDAVNKYKESGVIPALYWYFDFDDTIVRISDSERGVNGRLLFNPHLVDSIIEILCTLPREFPTPRFGIVSARMEDKFFPEDGTMDHAKIEKNLESFAELINDFLHENSCERRVPVSMCDWEVACLRNDGKTPLRYMYVARHEDCVPLYSQLLKDAESVADRKLVAQFKEKAKADVGFLEMMHFVAETNIFLDDPRNKKSYFDLVVLPKIKMTCGDRPACVVMFDDNRTQLEAILSLANPKDSSFSTIKILGVGVQPYISPAVQKLLMQQQTQKNLVSQNMFATFACAAAVAVPAAASAASATPSSSDPQPDQTQPQTDSPTPSTQP